ncbi:MAG: chromosomal replication initiator protein DnaA [Candidatus Pacebacteria bacterium]|nr:chromosomal replication initiator protein DnaA [Candidatus Paceibacterota bacterium]MDD5356830.1 chromosomal replication initiator protein DnaA [Candidatus Paceibacterota bacterium]
MDNKKLWGSVLAELELSLSKANFHTWFKDTAVTKQEEGMVYLNVPNAFVKDWLYNKYHRDILKALRTYGENVRSLEYVVSKDEGRKKEGEATRQATPIQSNELPLNDYYINKEDNLNPKYTFDAFVVGPFNDLAFAASQAVIKKPGTAYNPLFVYGNTGHGKTHLIQAIGNSLKGGNPGRKIFYVTSETFAVDYITSVQNNKPNQFKEKYRKYDVLIMDDIQFLSKKTQTQEELFHLFNALYENNKQIVFSSDKHPNYIPDLEERLKSRFSAGMIVEIPPPDYESRVAILKAKAKQNNFTLSDEAIDYLSSSIEGNIRELEGVLNSIICQTQLKNSELGLADIKNLIKNTSKPKKNISPKDIIKIISDFYNIEEASIYEKTRKKEIVKPRQLIMYILREDFNVSYPSIGQKLGGRDHTTVMHSCEKIKNDLKVDQLLVQELSRIRALI